MPAYYAAAKASIADPTLEHTQLALIQNEGALGVFGDELTKMVNASALTGVEKARFNIRLDAAKAATRDYLTFLTALEAMLKAGGARSFRNGKNLYAQKFAFDIQSGFSAEQLYQRALAEKKALHGSMEKLARELWPKYMGNAPMPADRLVLIRAVIDELSKRHTMRQAFVETIRQHIPNLEAFVRNHDLLDQDASRPLIVRETPPYMRGGGAGASVSAPGPFDPRANPITTFHRSTNSHQTKPNRTCANTTTGCCKYSTSMRLFPGTTRNWSMPTNRRAPSRRSSAMVR